MEELYNGIRLPDVWPPRDMDDMSLSELPVPYLENRPASFDIRFYVKATLFSIIKGYYELVIRRGNNLRRCWTQHHTTSLVTAIGLSKRLNLEVPFAFAEQLPVGPKLVFVK